MLINNEVIQRFHIAIDVFEVKIDKWLYLCNLGGHRITLKLEVDCEDECESNVTNLSSESACDKKNYT